MKVKIKAVEIKFLEEEFEGDPGDALFEFQQAHPLASIEYYEVEFPNGKIERVDPRSHESEIIFPASSLN